ncbi:hypothetical protein [Glutamicibacter sp.]|uniref:hypothetical protein n=1 Tax=Glutamicibacter sp. TaxID=1931995 RepID=UPI003D6A94F2
MAASDARMVVVGNLWIQTCRIGLSRTPQVVRFARDINGANDFSGALGFQEVFCTPRASTPTHVDHVPDGFRLCLATEGSTREDQGLNSIAAGQRAAVIRWTDDVPAGYRRLIGPGATPVKTNSPSLDRLLIAWVEDPVGHLAQIVQPLI